MIVNRIEMLFDEHVDVCLRLLIPHLCEDVTIVMGNLGECAVHRMVIC